MKKAFCLALLLALCLICCACGEDAEVAPTVSTPTGVEPCAHAYKITESVNASCTANGMLSYQCEKCSHQYQVEQPKLVHIYLGGGCTDSKVCALCGGVGEAPKGHQLNENDICTVCGFANFSQGLLYATNSEGTGYVVSGIGTCMDTELVIPKTYLGKPVTGIYDSAFMNYIHLTAIHIPDGITSIGDDAFNGCIGLTEITIPDGVTSIGGTAFRKCTGLTEITIPDGVTSIGFSAFRGCTGLTDITIPDSVTSIGNDAFQGCTNLNSVTVDPDNPVYHSSGNCLIETASKTLVLGCANSVIPIDGSVTSIGESAFEDCAGLTEITIPDGVTSIGISAFQGCTGLTEITISDGVTSIDLSAFMNCTGLTEITIPDSVTSIDSHALYGCTDLTRITFNGTMYQWIRITKLGYWNSYTGDYVIYCTDGEITK